ncbi:hypothetical protein A8950_0261 [Dongia mobilis]|uniref:Uncharacterized protein n=1 Tax=Dongia mobilis TaxID=578943 RepID=A0A4R6WW24_9PROT|nr:hypothetical protein A8950_0261 [Dongia mobilis]
MHVLGQAGIDATGPAFAAAAIRPGMTTTATKTTGKKTGS